MTRQINVHIPDGGSYPILIGYGSLDTFAQNMGKALLKSASSLAVVTNDTLHPIYSDALKDAFPQAAQIVIPDGEVHKNLTTVAGLYSQFVAAGLDRKSIVIAFGGGVVGDTAGFAAASYMRGVRFVQMPTSLLAMVDASVGGKVGVDLLEGKNLVGAFKQPEAVVIDLDVLDTLPDNELACGMAEVVKHGFLADETLIDSQMYTQENRADLIYRAIKVKVDVIEQDPYEQNIRAHLNLGHTFAHAIERVSAYTVPHGEAVGMGLMAAAHLSYVLGECDSEVPETTHQILTKIGLPIRTGGLEPEALYQAMTTDKKWQGGQSRFVLLRGIGKPFIITGVPKSEVIHVLEELR